MDWHLLIFFAALIGAGLLAGFIGGMFGVGGGIVLVPALFHLLGALNVGEEARAHVAVATSLSTIIATSWRSLEAHRKAGAVDFEVLKTWTPWIALGAACGATLAGASPGALLLIVFGLGSLAIAANMSFGDPSWRLAADLPSGGWRAGLASGIGVLSALMGVGGGALGVTLMTLCGRPIHQAVATASGFGAAIAIPATLGYIFTGLGHSGLPPLSLGYVNLPGFVALGVMTGVAAPYGARLAHRLPQKVLRRSFAAFMAVMAVNLLLEAFKG